MKHQKPSPDQDRILKLVSLCLASNGLRSGEIEAAAAMTADEVRTATKWLSENGFLDLRERSGRFDFGRRDAARQPLLFWTLTEKGRQRTTPAPADSLPSAQPDVRGYW